MYSRACWPCWVFLAASATELLTLNKRTRCRVLFFDQSGRLIALPGQDIQTPPMRAWFLMAQPMDAVSGQRKIRLLRTMHGEAALNLA